MKQSLIAVLAMSLLVACEHHHDTPPPAPSSDAGPPANAVQAEMRLLSAAMHAAVDGVAAGDVRPVEHAIHAVHAAKEDTEAALEHGYKPPKSGDMKRFKELDEAFHGNLERLADASRANDVAKTADAIGPTLQSCRGCHAEFRK